MNKSVLSCLLELVNTENKLVIVKEEGFGEWAKWGNWIKFPVVREINHEDHVQRSYYTQ